MTVLPPHSGAASLADPIALQPMLADHASDVIALHETVFGPGRFARTAFRLREQAAPLLEYSFLCEDRAQSLIGAVSTSRIVAGEKAGVLLGPLAVLPTMRDLGVGKALLKASVQAAHDAGEAFVLLVGDLPYYAHAGFVRVPHGKVSMPGPVDPARLLVACHGDFTPQDLDGAVRGVSVAH